MEAVLEQELAADRIAASEMDTYEGEVAKRVNALCRKINELVAEGQKLRELFDADPTTELAEEISELALAVLRVRREHYELVADALAGPGMERIHTAHDVEEWVERAVEMGAARPPIGVGHVKSILRLQKVPNAHFRAEALRQMVNGRDLSTIGYAFVTHLRALERAHDANYYSKGFLRANGDMDATRLERVLGMRGTVDGNGDTTVRLFVPYEQGVALARALNMTPTEAGV